MYHKDHLENQGSGYGKYKPTAFTVLTQTLTGLSLMQLQTTEAARTKNQSQRHSSV